MFWLSRITEHSHYASGLLGPMMVTALGMGLIFVPLSLVALARVANNDAGVASSLLNTGQQVGGSIGLAILGTVAWSAVANSIHCAVGRGAAAAKHATAHLSGAQAGRAAEGDVRPRAADRFSKGYLVSAGIALLALIITLVAIRVKKSDLAGHQPDGGTGRLSLTAHGSSGPAAVRRRGALRLARDGLAYDRVSPSREVRSRWPQAFLRLHRAGNRRRGGVPRLVRQRARARPADRARVRRRPRYRALDEQKPTWLALYELDGPEVIDSPEYKALAGQASDRDKAVSPRWPPSSAGSTSRSARTGRRWAARRR